MSDQKIITTNAMLNALPRGKVDFSSLRRGGYIYVDKSRLIFDLACQSDYFFISRPRRFGKTLLISTFKSLFQHGLRDFKGLAIEKLWTDEQSFPVIHLDFTACNAFTTFERFQNDLSMMLLRSLNEAGLKVTAASPQEGIASGIEIFEATLKANADLNIVLLIDEYDSPLNNTLNEPELFEAVTQELNSFWSAVKRCSGFLRFMFCTGISKYRNLNLFSGTNFVTDLSFDPQYGSLLGYTEDEIRHYFDPFIENAGSVLGISYEQCFCELRRNYNGYCFDRQAKTHVYTPWSVLSFLKQPHLGFSNYWYSSGGTPSVLQGFIARHSMRDPSAYGKDISVPFRELDSSKEINSLNEIALLYQTGYLTIKAVSPMGTTATLNFPNAEVADSMACLYKDAIFSNTDSTGLIGADELFYSHDPQNIATELNRIFMSIDYERFPIVDEASLNSHLYMFIRGSGINVKQQLHNAFGRSDLEFQILDKAFVIELKVQREHDRASKLLDKAVAQIKDHHYGEQQPCRELIRLALVFSLEKKSFVASALA